eukprot:superscaffoldBa00003374_g16784
MQQRTAVVFKSATGSGKTIDEIYAGPDSQNDTERETAPALASLGIGLESEVTAGRYPLRMAAVVNYSPPWWVNLLHRLPHFNLEFQLVSSDFRPEDSEYQK